MMIFSSLASKPTFLASALPLMEFSYGVRITRKSKRRLGKYRGLPRIFPWKWKFTGKWTNGAAVGYGSVRALAGSLVVRTVTLTARVTSAELGRGGEVDAEDGG